MFLIICVFFDLHSFFNDLFTLLPFNWQIYLHNVFEIVVHDPLENTFETKYARFIAVTWVFLIYNHFHLIIKEVGRILGLLIDFLQVFLNKELTVSLIINIHGILSAVFIWITI